MATIAKKYLYAKHRSLYQGLLTSKQLVRMKTELSAVIDPDYDKVALYEIDNIGVLQIEEIGIRPSELDFIL